MRFRSLPSDLSVGALEDLNPVHFWDREVLLQCQNCEFVDLKYFLCTTQHVTCSACALTRESKSGKQIWCRGCESWVHFSEETIPEATIRRMPFQCPCHEGFRGILAEIKAHLHSREPACHSNENGEIMPSENELRNAIDKSAEELEQCEAAIEELSVRCKIIERKATQTNKVVASLMSVAHIQLFKCDFDELCEGHTVICDPIDGTVKDYDVELGTTLIEKVGWLTVSVYKAKEFDRALSKKSLIFRVHDSDGGVMAALETELCETELEYCYRESGKQIRAQGVRLVRFGALKESHLAENHALIVSVESSM